VISCVDFDIICQNFYTASNLKDLLHNIHHKRIISFLHAICFTNKHLTISGMTYGHYLQLHAYNVL